MSDQPRISADPFEVTEESPAPKNGSAKTIAVAKQPKAPPRPAAAPAPGVSQTVRTSIAMPRDLHLRLRAEVLRRMQAGEKADVNGLLCEAAEGFLGS